MIEIDRIVNSVFNSITWVISEKESGRIWLVDCGDVDEIIKRIGDRKVEKVFLTHAHFDHIYGLLGLINRYPECRIYTNEAGRETLRDDKLNMSKYYGTPIKFASNQIETCEGGDTIKLADNLSITIIETPGHHPSCLTFLLDDYLFTGDAYIPGVKVVTNLPKGEKKLAEESLQKIINLVQGRTVLPGHYIDNNITDNIIRL